MQTRPVFIGSMGPAALKFPDCVPRAKQSPLCFSEPQIFSDARLVRIAPSLHWSAVPALAQAMHQGFCWKVHPPTGEGVRGEGRLGLEVGDPVWVVKRSLRAPASGGRCCAAGGVSGADGAAGRNALVQAGGCEWICLVLYSLHFRLSQSKGTVIG